MSPPYRGGNGGPARGGVLGRGLLEVTGGGSRPGIPAGGVRACAGGPLVLLPRAWPFLF